jgi:hypothetical protein
MLLRNTFKTLLLLLAIGCLFISCNDDDFSTNPSYQLSFSRDTLTFDTLFTTVGSTTQAFMIYNKNSKPIKISEIKLADNSTFRINVDGVSGHLFTNVEIRANDSLYVFVEVTIDPKDENLPFLVEDSILFYTNTNAQQVKLIAYGQDAIVFTSRTLPDTTLLGEKPYLIYGDLIAANLTIEKNCKLYFHNKANLIVNGDLRINGTPEEPVILRGDRLDYFMEGYKYDDLPGQWGGILLTGSGRDHYIGFANIRNGKTGIQLENSTLKIENTLIHNFDTCGIKAKQAEIWIGNSLIANCAENCLQFTGGRYNIIQTTIAGYYSNMSADTRRSGTSVLLKNTDGKDNYALSQANFKNTIIYGSLQNEITLIKEDAAEFNYSFSHCLLKAKENDFDNDKMTGNSWNEDPSFISTKFVYDFRLDANSPAIAKGDASTLSTYPYDLDGVLRPAETPDLGAYEHVTE